MDDLRLRESLSLDGQLTFTVFDEEQNIVDQWTGHNVICNAGLAIFCGAVAWSGIQDQAAALGLSTSGSYLTPLYGAIGTGTTTPTANDTQLTTEVARSTVAGASGSVNQVLFTFFFSTVSFAGAVAEAGVFCNATPTINTGYLLDHVLISPTVAKTSSQTATLQFQLTFS